MNKIAFLSGLFMSVLLTSCGVEEDGGGDPHGSEVENELTLGRIYLADGLPAVGARVKVFPVNHLPSPEAVPKTSASAEIVYSAFTDENGEFTIDSLNRGEYNILASLDGELSYMDSVYLSDKKVFLPKDTLRIPGGVAGVLALQPNHSPRTTTVQVLGTETYVNVDEQGRFRLSGLAEGRYRARLATTEDEYTQLYFTFAIRSGYEDTLADTLRLPYTGIPVVMNLRAQFDTAKGIATIRWSGQDYSQLSRYAIFRDSKDSPVLSGWPIATIRDSVFHDTLFSPNGLGNWEIGHRSVDVDGVPGYAFDLEYRVRVIDRSDRMGLAFDHAPVAGASQNLVATSIGFELSGGIRGEVSIGDSIAVEAAFHNPTRNHRTLRWYDEREDKLVRKDDIEGRRGTERLTVAGSDRPGEVGIRVEAEDETGRLWTSRFRVRVVADAPKADAGQDTLVPYLNSTLHLQGRGSDVFGSIRKWEWDIGGRGNFSETSTGDTSFTLDTIPRKGVVCVLRVTDDDGLAALDTVMILPILLSTEDSQIDAGAVTVDNLIYVIGGVLNRWDRPATGKVVALDPISQKWITKASMPTPRKNLAVAEFEGKIYAMGGIAADGTTSDVVEIYDPVTDSWSSGAKMPVGRHSHFLVSSQNELVVMLGENPQFLEKFGWDEFTTQKAALDYYRPGEDAWSRRAFFDISDPHWRQAWAMGVLADGLYTLVGESENSEVRYHDLSAFNMERLGNAYKPSPPTRTSSVVVKNRIHFVDAGEAWYLDANYGHNRGLRAYSNNHIKRRNHVLSEYNGMLYVIGGINTETGEPELRVEEIPSAE